MKDLLLVLLLAVVIVQGAIIACLMHKVNVQGTKIKTSKKISRACLKTLIKALAQEQEEASRYKDGYYDCHAAYRTLHVENKHLKHSVTRLEKAYNVVCGNLYDLIQSGRVIRHKEDGNITLLDFYSLTKEQVNELFALKI